MRYYILTLGCPKNSVDSEGMHSILAAQGHTAVPSSSEADVVIVNTCSFIAAARDETLAVLREMGEQKQPQQHLVAAGCMAESHTALVQAVPGVDATLSTQQWMQIGNVVRQFENGAASGPRPSRSLDIPVIGMSATAPAAPGMIALVGDPATPEQVQGYADWRTTQIRRTMNGPSAYLKISDGCNLRCAFCTIPSFKGDMRSKPMGAILGEAQELAALGVREIVLVAQHLTDYGRDLKLTDGLATLLDELCQVVPQDTWIRLMYAYPHGITPRLIETMARHPQICKYLDMPLQHAHPDMLRRMRRPPDTERTKATIAALREAMPDLALRSTFIVGYPGETKEEFKALLAFLEAVQIDRVGAFRYSQEPGTHAATLPNQVPAYTTERRWHRLMQTQQPISYERNRRWEGRTITVLVEGKGETEDGQPLLVGRSFRDAPEVDGQVFIWGEAPAGSMIQATITEATAYDLWGELA
ncbi:MAG: 30S ribosomal protein S12 methylthiotransferase RimO [Chloroflexaceae bacterium]|nr:30S ribosomal protein S12 methylthiotransferase RimO [Chloroflexaceae bacterium]